jgi:hypothetical protein
LVLIVPAPTWYGEGHTTIDLVDTLFNKGDF